ncbi:glycosyltransferase [Lachnospiraceae bacterium LCP25S3_G4]
MNVLLITMGWPQKNENNLYSDFMEEFVEDGHSVTVLAIDEKKNIIHQKASLEKGIYVIRVAAGSIQKTNKYKKVIVSFLAGIRMLFDLRKYTVKKKFDFILYSTPPITLTPAVILLKRKYQAKLYLLLKDIWPQDSVDLGAMRKGGIVWFAFRLLEIITYSAADYIGCMSPANVRYVRKHNPYLKNKIVEVCPNSKKLRKTIPIDRIAIREKYGLPKEKLIYLYGGNLGKAQGVEFLIDIFQQYKSQEDIYFLVLGSGTAYENLERSIKRIKANNVSLRPEIPMGDYKKLVPACDVGLILLNEKSSVPNFPSKLLTYLISKIPIIAAVDRATDIGDIIENAGCGLQIENGDLKGFENAVIKLSSTETRKNMGEKGYNLFLSMYTSKISYQIVKEHFSIQLEKKQKKFIENLRIIRWFFLTVVHQIEFFICYGDLPNWYYKKCGMKIGSNFNRQSDTKFDPLHCFLIEIGNQVTIANGVQFLAHDQSPERYTGYAKVGRILVGNNVFIGAKSLILPNVVIGDNVIIGAGSVVNKNIPSNTVVAGVPAEAIEDISIYRQKVNKKAKEKSVIENIYKYGKKLPYDKKKLLNTKCSVGEVYIKIEDVDIKEGKECLNDFDS